MTALKAGTLALVAALGLGAGSAAAQTTAGETSTTTTTTSQDTDYSTQDTGPDQSGAYILLGGGYEGYTGNFGDAINGGPMGGIYFGLQPFPAIGFELGYTGGFHNFALNLRDGADLIRHGPQVAVTLGVPLGVVKPYALAGIGVDFSTLRATDLLESNTDTGGFVPLGAGLMFNATRNVAIDARFQYHVLFDKASFTDAQQEEGGGRYQAQLSFGYMF
jgi:opacity protein-like surface antigen